jgi:hypothetical protein
MDKNGIDDRLTQSVELVSHEIRARILVVLAVQQRDDPQDPTLRFSELRSRVGHDDPGNFNYHLKRLTDGLVRQADTGTGYQLSDVGHRFVAALLSGQFDPDVSIELSSVETSCMLCENTAAVSYVNGTLRVDCESGHSFRGDVGPDIVTSRSIEEALDIALLMSLFDTRLVISGICPGCNGQTAGGLELTESDKRPVIYTGTCNQCGLHLKNTVGGCVLDHPAVVSLCYERGLDVREDAWAIMTHHIGVPTLLDDDPIRVEVEMSIDEDTLVLGLDETAHVVHVNESSSNP